jgi:hypothetical protein
LDAYGRRSVAQAHGFRNDTSAHRKKVETHRLIDPITNNRFKAPEGEGEMNRRTAVVLIALLVSAGCSNGARAETPLDKILSRYDACFHASTGHQFLANLEAEPNMVTEIAFQACSTEEQTLSSFLTLGGMSPASANAIILRHRNWLKHKITDGWPR